MMRASQTCEVVLGDMRLNQYKEVLFIWSIGHESLTHSSEWSDGMGSLLPGWRRWLGSQGQRPLRAFPGV